MQAADSIPRVILLGRLCLYGRGAERLHEQIVPLAARWTEPTRRKEPLKAYARDAETRTLELLERALAGDARRVPSETIQRRLLETVLRDVGELLPQLEPRAEELAALAIRQLQDRGEREERSLREILERQRGRVVEELDKHEKHEARVTQLTLEFSAEEKRQLQANVRAWHRRLKQFDLDLEHEPQRIRAFYQVRARRVEPVGLIYLWPESN